MTLFSRAFLAIFLFPYSLQSFSKVDPPNYDFSLNQLEMFMPGKPIGAVLKKYGEGTEVFAKGSYKARRLYIEQLRYKFPILVQTNGEQITDFYARLPAYFLHDIFHQSLINRIGPQDIYKRVEEQAVYIWKNKKGFNHVYSGACSITCFPVYYSVYPASDTKEYRPIIKLMRDQEFLQNSSGQSKKK